MRVVSRKHTENKESSSWLWLDEMENYSMFILMRMEVKVIVEPIMIRLLDLLFVIINVLY